MRAHRRLQMMCSAKRSFLSASAAVLAALATLSAQARPADPQKIGAPAAVQPRAAGLGTVAALAPAPEYVIGPNDTLSVLFWHDKDMSADVVVRPDGNISLPLLLGVDSGFRRRRGRRPFPIGHERRPHPGMRPPSNLGNRSEEPCNRTVGKSAMGETQAND